MHELAKLRAFYIISEQVVLMKCKYRTIRVDSDKIV